MSPNVFWAAAFCSAGALASGAPAYALSATDPAALSLEELLEVKVYAASKFPQKTTEAPASVTIITAEDIKTYGYRTLADLLKSVRSLYVTYDRNYTYLGVRGFERPGDYDSRILLLVDGYRLNDPIYDTAGIGTEFPLDLDLIDRVEIVRGPGSSIYGSNAFFAVLNVITKQGRHLQGAHAAGELGSFGSDRERLSYGKQSEELDWLVSASRYRSDGQDLFFPAFDAPETNDGLAENIDGDRYEKLFGKVSVGGATFTGGYSRRTKEIPTASYSTEFNDPHEQTADQWTFADLRYEQGLGAGWTLSPHLFYGDYRYDGTYPFADPTVVINEDLSRAQWWGAEAQLVGRLGPHTLLAGVEYQDNTRQDQINFDREPYELFLDDRRSSRREGLYVQNELALSRAVLLNAGLRYDHYSTAGDTLNPRVALLWAARPSTNLKAIYGTAFRAPNNYELYYAAFPNIANPDLDPERIRSYELIAEHYLGPNRRLTADFYYNRIDNLIDQITEPNGIDLVFRNVGRVDSRGAEFEAECAWTGDIRVRASYAWQIAKDRMLGRTLTDSPKHLAKLNLGVPIWNSGVRAGAELQYVSRRTTPLDTVAGAALVTNLTLSTRALAERLELSTSIYNLFDRDHADPARPEHMQDVIPQDGRSVRVKLAYRF